MLGVIITLSVDSSLNFLSSLVMSPYQRTYTLLLTPDIYSTPRANDEDLVAVCAYVMELRAGPFTRVVAQ